MIFRTVQALLLTLTFAFLPLTESHAHELGVIRVSVDVLDGQQLIVRSALPTTASYADPVIHGCQLMEKNDIAKLNQSLAEEWRFQCAPLSLKSSPNILLTWPFEAAYVSQFSAGKKLTSQLYDSNNDVISVPLVLVSSDANGIDVFVNYLSLGVEHILIGIDHLAFIIGLCLLASRWQLVKIITAFTIGHSITLALSIYGLVQVPIAPIEACIALSIVFVAYKALKPSAGLTHGIIITMLFGLLHGLGFASVLSDIGLPPGQLPIALLAFNIGVELGQIFFVAVLLSCAWLLTKFVSAKQMATSLAFIIGSAGAFWTIERVASFAF